MLTGRLVLLLVVFTASLSCAQQTLTWDVQSVVSLMEKVADWQLANPSHWPLKDWTEGTWYQGVMALSRVSLNNSAKYFDAMIDMSQDGNWTLGTRIYHADDHNVGQTYVELFLQSAKSPPSSIEYMLNGIQERFDYIIANPSNASLVFTSPHATDRWSWCDALFMSPPGWARLSLAKNDPKYLDFMIAEWFETASFLYDTKQHFFYRDSTYFNRTEKNGASVFWSRGNGWVLAGIARVLEFLPKTHTSRPKFEQIFIEIAEAALEVQPEDGVWRSSLFDPDSFPIPEASGTGLFTFGMLWGLNNGLLDGKKFCPKVMQAWQGLVSFVQDDGKLTHVQPVGGNPASFDVNSTEPYGVGAFLLSGEQLIMMSQRAQICA